MADILRPTRPVRRQVATYLGVGAAAFLVDFGLLVLLRSGLGLPAWLSAATAFLTSTAVSFLGQKWFSFASSAPLGRALWRYLVLLGANTVLTAAVVEAFDALHGSYLIGKVLTTVATTLWNFPLMRNWVYRTDVRQGRGSP